MLKLLCALVLAKLNIYQGILIYMTCKMRTSYSIIRRLKSLYRLWFVFMPTETWLETDTAQLIINELVPAGYEFYHIPGDLVLRPVLKISL